MIPMNNVGLIDLEKIKESQIEHGLFCPDIQLPKDWRMAKKLPDGFAAQRWDGLLVICSEAKELDGRPWRHVSASWKTRLPTYDELCQVKAIFIGDDRKAFMIFLAKKNHVNIHPNCLHLWACLDGDPLPEFSRGLGSI